VGLDDRGFLFNSRRKLPRSFRTNRWLLVRIVGGDAVFQRLLEVAPNERERLNLDEAV
jgi:hypothetical protein